MKVRRAFAIAVLGPMLLIGVAAAAAKGPLRRRPQTPPQSATVSFQSRALGTREPFQIALPPGYGSSRRRYPVVYALHGLPAGTLGYRSVPVARMAATAAAHPVIVVAPQGASAAHPDDEWHDWGSGRNWETAISSELVSYVDRHWRTIPDARSRAIIGMSAGGYGAAMIGLHHPETFSVVESWSGYFRPTTPDGSKTLHVGSAHDDEAADAHRFVDCLGRLDPRERPRLIGFYVGADDPYSGFLADNQRLHAELAAAGVPHRFAVYRGGHDDAFWASHERAWLGDVVAHLDGVAPARPTDAAAARDAARRAGCPAA